MKKILGTIITIVIFLCLSANSYALLLLSGDSNIVNDLPDGLYDNGTFFSNVLGDGSNVLVLSEGNYEELIYNYYDGLSGVSASYNGTVTAGALAGIDLFVATTPEDAFTTDELIALNNFYTGGGSIFFLGDHSGWDSTSNSYINTALTYLGSEMQIILQSSFDSGNHNTTNIAADPLTLGVKTLEYYAPSEVTGGTTLFFGAYENQPFVAYESGAPIPEPATILLLVSGILGLAGFRRKFKK